MTTIMRGRWFLLGGGAAQYQSTGQPIPPGLMHLFKVDVTEVMTLRPAGDHLTIDSWRAGRGLKRIEHR
jgi:hypothetical protein